MNNHVAKWAGLLSFALTLAFFSPQQAAADDNDPPARVARLSFTRGAVSFEPGGAEEWVAARINRPMTTGDRLWTDAGAFAEMNTGSAYLRLGSNTGFSFLNLSDYATQIQLTEGTLLARVRRLDQNETFEIDTPNLAFSLYQPGIYEVTVNQAGDVTVVQVRQGEGEVTGGGASYSLQQGDQGRFAGTDGLVADMSSYRSRSDEFENWSSLRDRRIDHSYSSRYVSPDVIGYEDLDQYGGWRSSGEYGNVWYPHTTEVGWAPYHNGHWAYIAPWGYTWVDDEPWGFAPFHYGRWVNVEGAWGWVPGPRESDYGRGEAYVRPVYAPALVAWVGGAHFSIGVSVGGGGGRYSEGENVGWFPLGPREVYVPSYPVSRTYVNNVNVSNTNVTNTVVNNYYNTTVVNNTNNSTNVNVTNVKYVNQTVPGAVTATTPQAFVSAQPVAKNVVRVNQQEVAAAPVRIVAPPVAPSREAVLGTTVQAAAKPPEAVVNRTVVAKAAPPPPPVPFVQQQKAIEANGGKPLPVSEIRQMRVQEQQQVQRGQQQQQQRQQRPQSGQPPQAPPQTQQPAVRIAPPAQPQNARPAQAQANAGNPPAATPNNQQPPNNRPASQNTQQQPPQQQPQPANRPAQPETASPNRPNNPSPLPQQTNRPEQQNNNANRPNIPNNPPNRPPTPTTPDPALEQKHQQELEQLHKQQDLERQRVEQQHQQELKLQEQKAADQQRQQQQQLAQKNAEQQQQQDRKVQEQKAADQQRQQQQQQAQRNADQQQQQDRKAQLQKIADQQLQQQQQQAQRNADQQQQAQKNAEQQRQQQLQQAQRAADQQRQQLDQKHQQELMQLEQKHAQEQQILNQKHDQEHQQQQQQQQQQRQQPPPQQQQRPQQPPPQRQPPPQKDKSKPDRPPQRG